MSSYEKTLLEQIKATLHTAKEIRSIVNSDKSLNPFVDKTSNLSLEDKKEKMRLLSLICMNLETALFFTKEL